MVFPTVQFLLFFTAIFALGLIAKRNGKAYKFFLLGTSFAFYAVWNWGMAILLFFNILINYLANKRIENSRSRNSKLKTQNSKQKLVLIVMIILNVSFLALFKYYNFFIDSLQSLLNSLHIAQNLGVLQILIPLGISYFTFKNISHLVEVYKGNVTDFDFIGFANYIAFFPQIASGPIGRPQWFYDEYKTAHTNSYNRGEVITLILGGLFKKYVISSFLFAFVGTPFSAPLNFSSLELSLALLAYACLIYVDFSGYTDMANGISNLLGFSSVPNFNMPYQARSLSDFWKRWHISLSTWLRDYVYIPLGGNRKGTFRTYSNLIITMLIGGLWHGAGWNFLVWGLLHGIGSSISQFLRKTYEGIKMSATITILSVLCTFIFVCITWIFFNTSDIHTAVQYVTQLISFSDMNSLGTVPQSSNLFSPLLIAVIVFVLFLQISEIRLYGLFTKVFNINIVLTVLLVIVLGMGILLFGPTTLPPFIYFGF